MITTASSALTSDDWYAMPELSGERVQLRPLRQEDARAYFDAAVADDAAAEVFRWLPAGPPVEPADAYAHVNAALAARAHGQRLPYAQIDPGTGAFLGTTSLYDIVPALRTLAIGHTWLSRPHWRSGVNSEAKLLLLTYAFETLQAARVVWHTDIYNERSQAAIERLGATREGVLRKHRIRTDGSWRDTVQYSMTDDDWVSVKARLQQHR